MELTGTQIEDFEPHQSIVVTPAKMAAFYEKVKLASEIYPWAGKRLSRSRKAFADGIQTFLEQR